MIFKNVSYFDRLIVIMKISFFAIIIIIYAIDYYHGS